MNVDNASGGHSHGSHGGSASVAPRPIQAGSDLNRWELADLLNPRPPRKMSLDFSSSYYHGPQPPYDQQDAPDAYDLFPHRPSASLPPTLYSQSAFSDSAPAFNNYDMISSLPSSYGSGKVSPLTPSDPVAALHPFPPPKDFPQQPYSDLPDRRVPSNPYHTEIIDDFAMGNINPYPPSALQHFQGRFPPDNRFPPTVPSHVPSISPHATGSFRDGPVPPYDDMPHYMAPSPHQDMSLRMPTVDETLARMKLQGHAIMGSSNDLQTFIRPYLDQYIRTPNRLAFGERTVIVMSSKVAQKSYGTEKRFVIQPHLLSPPPPPSPPLLLV
ncbi:hypothetical protein H0H87_005193 [Tephrocybe sp. NHM501043]|nr:hypothetical protein H0H87_005193 [Tephrocybe sp. NHM501043]